MRREWRSCHAVTLELRETTTGERRDEEAGILDLTRVGLPERRGGDERHVRASDAKRTERRGSDVSAVTVVENDVTSVDMTREEGDGCIRTAKCVDEKRGISEEDAMPEAASVEASLERDTLAERGGDRRGDSIQIRFDAPMLRRVQERSVLEDCRALSIALGRQEAALEPLDLVLLQAIEIGAKPGRANVPKKKGKTRELE